MSKIELTDSVMNIVMKMSEGNPGAVTVLIRLLNEGNVIDPQALMGNGGIAAIMKLDTFGIYGHRIWMLYKDCCKEDPVKTMAMLRAVQMGLIDEASLHIAIDNYGQGVNLDEILAAVKAELEGFGNA